MPLPVVPARRLRAVLTLEGSELLGEFQRFLVVGLAGFAVDISVVYGLRGSLGIYVAGMVAYLAAATGTWVLNRSWTFAGRASVRPFGQWLRYLGANSVGAVLNRGTFLLLVWLVPLFAVFPVLAVAAGTIGGMLANFTLSRRLVFQLQP